MKKRFAKLFLALGVLCLLFAGALFLFRTSVVAYGLALFLEMQGARQVSVAVKRVDSVGIDFEHLDLVLRRGSRLLAVELENLTVSFAPAELRRGQVQDIALEQLTLRHSVAGGRTAAEPAAPFDLPDLLTRLSGDWHNQLPFSSATIATLKLSGPELPPALTQPLTLTMTRTDSGIKVVSRPLSQTNSADVRLILEKNGEALALNLAAAQAGELAATLSGTRLDGSFSLDPARLNSLLPLFGANAVQIFDQLGSDRLAGSFRANLEYWPLFDMQARLTAKSLTLADTALKGIVLEFDLKGDGSATMGQALQVGRLQLNVDRISRSDIELVGIEGQFEITPWEGANYRLEKASAFKMTAFKSANISFQDAYFPLSGDLSLTDHNQLHLQLDSEDHWRVAELKSADISIGEATIRPAFTLQLTATDAYITYAPALRVNLNQLSVGDLRIPSLAFHPSATAQLYVDTAAGVQWTLQNSHWLMQLPLVENAQMQIRPGEFALSLTQLGGAGRTVSLSAAAQTERIAIAVAGRSAYLRDVAMNFSRTPQKIKGAGDLRIGPYPQRLSFSVQHELAFGRGTFRLTTPSPLVLGEQLALSRLLEPWEFPGDAVNGQISLTIEADWAPESAPTAVAAVKLDDIGGKWQKITFNGLSLRHLLKVWPAIESQDQALISLNLIVASGVPITETQANLRFLQAGQDWAVPFTIELDEGHFNLFGSTFSLTPFTYRSNAVENHVRIKTTNLNLARLTPLFKAEGLELNGLVDAILPLELGADGVEMVDGTIRQNGPGVIIYRPQDREMLKSAGMPEIIIKALENFHYDQLEADVDYQPDGQLDLAVRLRGKSPSAGTERPIHLNLNIEQNLLSLIESLQYSDVFDRKVEEYIHKKR